MITSNPLDGSPIDYNAASRSADGEFDEANAFMPDDVVSITPLAIVQVESREELEALFAEVVTKVNDEGDAVADEQELGERQVDLEVVDALDAFMDKLVAPAVAREKLTNARKKLSRGGLTKAEADEIRAKVVQWEMEVEWRTEATAVLFNQIECRCGSVTKVFGGYFERQQHRTQTHSRRWQAVGKPKPDLQREVLLRPHAVPMCEQCLVVAEWPLNAPSLYLQGD